MRLAVFVPGSFTSVLLGHEARSLLRLHVSHGGEAGIHLQEDNTVSFSQGVYTLTFAESGQVERVQPLSRRTCVNVYVCLCSRSNLEAAASLT